MESSKINDILWVLSIAREAKSKNDIIQALLETEYDFNRETLMEDMESVAEEDIEQFFIEKLSKFLYELW